MDAFLGRTLRVAGQLPRWSIERNSYAVANARRLSCPCCDIVPDTARRDRFLANLWFRARKTISTSVMEGFKTASNPHLVKIADGLPEGRWKRLERPPRYQVKTEERERPFNFKEQVVREREFENIRLKSEDVAEFDYRPANCRKSYRMVVVRKNLSVEKGERRLFDDVRFNSESPIIPSN